MLQFVVIHVVLIVVQMGLGVVFEMNGSRAHMVEFRPERFAVSLELGI